jgi:hypothetical protein
MVAVLSAIIRSGLAAGNRGQVRAGTIGVDPAGVTR